MKKINNKGFAVTGILYTLLVLFLVLMISLISVFSNRKNVLDKLKEGIVKDSYLNSIYSYEYNDNIPYYVFNTPVDGTYKIELWGAQGGALGGYVSGEIVLKANSVLYVYVGQKGLSCMPYTLCDGYSYNGGGSGGFFTYSSYNPRSSGGGGATDVRIKSGIWNDDISLNSRIMVASAGGACIEGTCYGGGLTGYVASDYDNGGAGTQTTGGSATADATNGGFGYGGNGYISNPTCPNSNDGYGAGSGYYGGGGGRGGTCVNSSTNRRGSGGSGSSFISGHTGCVAITSENNRSPKDNCTDGTTDHNCSIHYSGYEFTNTIMIDGGGYSWTTEKGTEIVGMPTHDGAETMTGNTGNGYAKITIVKVD